jgi:methylmalonyl-CoA mutase cobalamin-binding domain/chain
MEEKIKSAFLGMKRNVAIDTVRAALDAGVEPLVVLKACREAMQEVGKKFETGEFFLSELIYSAEVFKAVVTILEPALALTQEAGDSKGVIVFGTPLGDIHDLGKNLVITMLRAQGFTVHDLGVNVPPERLVDEVVRTDAPVLAMSVLITPAFIAMKEVINLLEKKGIRDKTFVIIGGGVTTEFARRELGADAQTLDPVEAIELCRKHMK